MNWRNESGIIPGYESSDLVKINDYWMKVCKNLDYGHIKNSRHEQFKDTQICTNFRKWRKCHFHLPTENWMLNIWLHNISSLCYFHPPPLNTSGKNMICDNTLIRLNINIYVILLSCICHWYYRHKKSIKTNKYLKHEARNQYSKLFRFFKFVIASVRSDVFLFLRPSMGYHFRALVKSKWSKIPK